MTARVRHKKTIRIRCLHAIPARRVVPRRVEPFERYNGLTSLAFGGSAGYRHKCGLGYPAPWASVSGGASYDNYREDLRTSTRLDLRAETGKRFTEQLDASAGVYYERR